MLAVNFPSTSRVLYYLLTCVYCEECSSLAAEAASTLSMDSFVAPSLATRSGLGQFGVNLAEMISHDFKILTNIDKFRYNINHYLVDYAFT